MHFRPELAMDKTELIGVGSKLISFDTNLVGIKLFGFARDVTKRFICK